MKIQFLGTGAADWDITTEDKDDEFRRYSSAVINDVLLIDPGPCVIEAAQKFGVDLNKIKYIINTHSHRDHYNKETVEFLEEKGAEFIAFTGGEEKVLGAYTVKALTANHGTCLDAVHFLIDDGTKRVFYALDSAWLLYDEVKAIKEKKVDFAVFDGTIGDIEGDYRIFEHNNLYMVEEMKKTLKPFIDRFMISHMARTLHTDHQTLVNRMKPSGIEVARDGLVVKI